VRTCVEVALPGVGGKPTNVLRYLIIDIQDGDQVHVDLGDASHAHYDTNGI